VVHRQRAAARMVMFLLGFVCGTVFGVALIFALMVRPG
jgi:hypothetical protein